MQTSLFKKLKVGNATKNDRKEIERENKDKKMSIRT